MGLIHILQTNSPSYLKNGWIPKDFYNLYRISNTNIILKEEL